MNLDISTSQISAALGLVEARLAAEQEDRNIPGLSAGVVYDQNLIWHKGYGYANLEDEISPDQKTIYRVASITKLFTATMLMQLRDAGKLQLDDPIENYVPAFKIASGFDDARPPTFRQIASHGAGIPREGAHEGWRTMDMPTIEILLEDMERLEAALPMMSEPKYSNLGIAVMGHALSRIAGQPYDDYIHEFILDPLGMNDSGFNRDRYSDAQIAVGYYKDDDRQFVAAPHWDEQGFRPAGGMYSSVEDITRFIALQFRDGKRGGPQILGSNTLREMHSPVTVSPDFETAFGIGWGIRRVAGHKVIGHSGGLPGYSTNIALVPDVKLATIVFTNTGTEPVAMCDSMLEVLLPIFDREIKRQQPKPSKAELESWKQYTGTYAWLSMDDAPEVKIANDRLMVVFPDASPTTNITLIPHDKHRFRMKGGFSNGELAVFETSADGTITGVMLGGYPFKRVAHNPG